MTKPALFRSLALASVLIGVTPLAQAQFAVIDVASLTQLVSEVQTLEQQLATARSQLTQAQAEFQAMTGGRGMERLLAGTTRNYLPTDWVGIQGLTQGGGSSFPALTAAVRDAMSVVSVLSAQQLVALSPVASAQLQAQRQSAAILQGLTHAALLNASSRFTDLQQLISAIPQAADQKAVLDLQARITAEGGMLQNEHTKLDILYQSLQAERVANAQRARELALAGHGDFSHRWQPRP
jgi:type IV secretion system protein VirB5